MWNIVSTLPVKGLEKLGFLVYESLCPKKQIQENVVCLVILGGSSFRLIVYGKINAEKNSGTAVSTRMTSLPWRH